MTNPLDAPPTDKPSATNVEDSQRIFAALSTLQQLIFELQSEVFDVKYRLELLEHHIALATDLNTARDAPSSPATTGTMVPILLPPRQN
jgi:hypothetical protein